jgi:MFS family permease
MPLLVPVLGYMPQHLPELTGSVLGVLFVANGVFVLITGHVSEPRAERFGVHTIRAFGGAVIVLGVVVAVSSLLIDAEPPGHEGNHWGDTTDFVVTGIWLGLLGVIVAIAIRKIVTDERRRRVQRR